MSLFLLSFVFVCFNICTCFAAHINIYRNGQHSHQQKATNELVSTLVIMGYDRNYVERAIQVHKRSKFGTRWNISLLVEIISRLKQKEESFASHSSNIFIPHYPNYQSALHLNVNDNVDYRYENGRFILCRIIQKNISSHAHILKLHPLGRPLSDTKYDKFCNVQREYFKLAPAKSISLRRIHSQQDRFANIKCGDYIDINVNGQWKSGQITKLDSNSSQVKVTYLDGSYWTHLENTKECAQFRTMCTHNFDQYQLQRSQSSSSNRQSISFLSMSGFGHGLNAIPQNIKMHKNNLKFDYAPKYISKNEFRGRAFSEIIGKKHSFNEHWIGDQDANTPLSASSEENLDDGMTVLCSSSSIGSPILHSSKSDEINTNSVMANEQNIDSYLHNQTHSSPQHSVHNMHYDDDVDEIKNDHIDTSVRMIHGEENEQLQNEIEEIVQPFVSCMSMNDIYALQELDRIDFRNPFGRFCRATIVGKDENEKTLKLHFDGMSPQWISNDNDGWDGWIKICKSNQHNFAYLNSISLRKCHKIKLKFLRIGSLVELRPRMNEKYHSMNEGDEWKCAKICDIDYKSGQIQCKYMHSNGHWYLYWTHCDNEDEIVHIDNFYQIGQVIFVFNALQNEWMNAKIVGIEMNNILIKYVVNHLKDRIHVVFDCEKLLFPKLKKDIKNVENAIKREGLNWKLIKVTPTNDSIFQCFAYLIYGDLNQAQNVKKEYLKSEQCDDLISALCEIYKVRVRVFGLNEEMKRLDIINDRGVDEFDVPMILLSKHLNKYFNVIIDEESLHQIPIYYNE